jgi:hypothetical protein
MHALTVSELRTQGSVVISNWGHERPCFYAGKSTAAKIRAQTDPSGSIICCEEP